VIAFYPAHRGSTKGEKCTDVSDEPDVLRDDSMSTLTVGKSDSAETSVNYQNAGIISRKTSVSSLPQ
jgi:hypothetical protein